MSAWSLQGQKTVTGGEGGILLTNNKQFHDRAVLQGHYNKRAQKEISNDSELYDFYLTGMGLKLRAHPLAIVIADEQFKLLPKYLETRERFAKKITTELSKYPFLKVSQIGEGIERSWYAYSIQFISENAFGINKEDFVKVLHAEGLSEVDIPGSTGLLHNLPLFTKPNRVLSRIYPSELPKQCGFKVAEKFVSQFLKIPVWSFEDEEQIIDNYVLGFKKVCQYIMENKKLY
jgi:dTDP-4-amino-4,6-dideoxygalactose transaminase